MYLLPMATVQIKPPKTGDTDMTRTECNNVTNVKGLV